MQKLIKLEEMVGKKQEGEEKPEGKVIVGPSGEAVKPLSSGNTPFLSSKSNYLFNHTHLLVCEFSLF